MLEYLAYMESVARMRETLRQSPCADCWEGVPARVQHTSRRRVRHGLALALRDVAAHLDPLPV